MNESLPPRAERHHKSAVKAKVPKAAEAFFLFYVRGLWGEG